MDSSSDDFSALRKLLKVKSYEQPPPRYFEDLPHGVIQRLRGPEGLRRNSLLRVLGFEFGLKPGLFYGLGAACCGLALYAGISLLGQWASPQPARSGNIAGMSQTMPGGSGGHSLLGQQSLGESGVSTNPVLSTEGVSYPVDGFRIQPTPVNYQPPR